MLSMGFSPAALDMQAAGATQTNELVNIPEFFVQHVAPELSRGSLDDLPIIKADALKFLNTFRSQIGKQEILAALPAVVRLLGAQSNVVHSYAATCLERLLVIKEPGSGGRSRFTPADVQHLLQPLLGGLFGALTLPDSEENE